MLRPGDVARPAPARTFTTELSWVGSPRIPTSVMTGWLIVIYHRRTFTGWTGSLMGCEQRTQRTQRHCVKILVTHPKRHDRRNYVCLSTARECEWLNTHCGVAPGWFQLTPLASPGAFNGKGPNSRADCKSALQTQRPPHRKKMHQRRGPGVGFFMIRTESPLNSSPRFR